MKLLRVLIMTVALVILASFSPVAAQDRIAEAQKAFAADIHAAAGLQCTSCHATSGAAGQPGYRPVSRTAIAPMCAKCHSNPAYMRQFDPQVRTDQFAQYLTSAHGKAMARGESRVATCADCHGAHGVTRVRDPRSPIAPLNAAKTCAQCHANAELMKSFGHDARPFADWSTSVHAAALLKRGDTSAPTCNTCHGSHGATPPGVTQVASVCAQCHVREAELFNASPKKAIFDAMGQAECLVCHSNHAIHQPSDTLIGLDEGAVCATCHDAATNGADTIKTVRQGLDDLAATIERAGGVVAQAERAGMLVDEAKIALQEGREQQIQARVLVHAFAAKPFVDVVAPGMNAAQQAQHGGEQALHELQVRRRGLAVATLLILGFLVTLGWKIRRLPVPDS
jgi:predicted CXXCH cytochrome family protein